MDGGRNFRTGLCSVSHRENSPGEILLEMSKAGLRYIEWGSDVHAPAGDTDALENIAKLQAKYGISCSSYGTYFRIGQTPTEDIRDYIRSARILGTDVLRLWCGVKNAEEYSPSERDALIKECMSLAEIARAEGVTLAMECHAGTYTNTTNSILELMGEVDSPRFRMYWQPSQYRSREENLRQARAIAKYTVNIHAFNWCGGDRFPLGDDVSGWREYLSEFDGTQTVLLEFMPDDSLSSLMREAEALVRILDTQE